jgi:hypothetical protein
MVSISQRGGSAQYETHLIGESRAATGAVGGKLAIVQMGWTV